MISSEGRDVMAKRLKKTIVFLLAILLAALAFPIYAAADMGPKDALTVTVENPPDEPYYLDLLTNEDGGSGYDNLGEERDKLNQTMLKLLYSKTDEGWWPAIAGGTNAPIFGSLTGTEKDGAMVHTFSYFGVPETYRVIIVTESGKVSVSDMRTRETLQSSVIYDFATGDLTEAPYLEALLLQFIVSLVSTVVIEGLLLLLFRFRLRENLLVFLLVNIITQVFLAAVTVITQFKYGIFATIFAVMFVEFIILIAESLVFARFLKGKTKGRRVAYAITANLVSLISGLVLMALV
jgi:hypothetical protein